MGIELDSYDFMKDVRHDLEYLLEEQKVVILEEMIRAMGDLRISKAELARRLGTSRAYITKLFRMNANFTLKSLVHIADVMGTKMSIHFHKEESRTAWFDLDRQPRAESSLESMVSAGRYKPIGGIGVKGDENADRTTAA